MSAWLNRLWYADNASVVSLIFLAPWVGIYRIIIFLRRLCYQLGLFKSYRANCPVIVVGNLSVGGTGKTPLVIYLVELLHQQHYRVAVVSRGYGGQAAKQGYPLLVNDSLDAELCGDEPVLIARRTQVPVVVASQRSLAVQYLERHFDCDIIISDDGLQHYALQRDIEICVIDGARRFGNGYCLPLGPLREPVSRMQKVDLCVATQAAGADEHLLNLLPTQFIRVVDEEEIDTQTLLPQLRNAKLAAMAGIGNPRRFFKSLTEIYQLVFTEFSFPDHHAFSTEDLKALVAYDYVLMTEKDAVKLKHLAAANFYYLAVQARLTPSFDQSILRLVSKKTEAPKIADNMEPNSTP